MKRKVITMCGSIKYKEEIMRITEELSLKGNCVISINFPVNELEHYTSEQISLLGELHKQKIAMSDAIYVVNVNNYIGSSTKKEIEYAKKLGKEIIYFTKE